MLKRKWIFGLCAFFLTGCSAFGPVKSSEFDSLIAAPLQPAAGKVLLARTGVWYPDMNREERSFADPVRMELGIVAIAEDGVYFEQWNKSTKAYEVKYQVLYKDIESASASSYGFYYQCYIPAGNHGADAFDIRIYKGQTLSRGGTQDACKLVETHIKSV